MEDGVSLPPELAAMPVKELNRSTTHMLTQLLDPPHKGYNRDGVMQNWEGLAELMHLDPQEIEFYENSQNPKESKTMGIIKKWSFSSGTSTLGKLWELIEQLERFDILNDDRLLARFKRDLESFNKRKELHLEEDRRYKEELDQHIRPLQDPQIDSNHQDVIEQRDRDHDQYRHIVVDDVLHPDKPQVIYDAFVSFCHSDFTFVQEMLDMVETKHGLRLCVNARDLIAGVSKHYVTAKLIADRCRKVILVMSPDFVSSPECEFQVKVALSLSPGAKQKILIPIVYRPCKIPLVLQHVCTVDYTRIDLADWFWTRLSASLRESYVSVTRHLSFDESVHLQRVEMELLPDSQGSNCLESSISGKIRPATIAPRFKGQSASSDNSVKKAAGTETRSLETSMEYEKSGFEFVSGEYRSVGSAPPEVGSAPPEVYTAPKTVGGPPLTTPETLTPARQPSHKTRLGKTSPRSSVNRTINHPSFLSQNLPNSTPNIRQNSPNSSYESARMSPRNDSQTPRTPGRNTASFKREARSQASGERSLESSMECERGNGYDASGETSHSTRSTRSSLGHAVRYPPTYANKLSENRELTVSDNGGFLNDALPSVGDGEISSFSESALYSLPSTDIKLPPIGHVPHSASQSHSTSSNQSKDDQYDHEQHALASLSMSSVEFHFQGSSPSDKARPVDITVRSPDAHAYDDDAIMSIEPETSSLKGIRDLFPGSGSTIGAKQHKNVKNESHV